MPPEPNPRAVFERLFGAGAPASAAPTCSSVSNSSGPYWISFWMTPTTSSSEMSNRDRLRMDEYLTSVREIERRIAATETANRQTPDPDVTDAGRHPRRFQEYMRLMYSMMLLAFQTDSTRICTFLLAHDGDNRPFPQLGIPEGHHFLTHHQNNAAKIEKVAQIENWYIEQFAWFLQEMDRTQDVDGKSLLHNSMIVIGCANADGNRHSTSICRSSWPAAAAARLTTGRYVRFNSQPMCNLFLSMIDRMGVRGVERFGDSTGRLEGL